MKIYFDFIHFFCLGRPLVGSAWGGAADAVRTPLSGGGAWVPFGAAGLVFVAGRAVFCRCPPAVSLRLVLRAGRLRAGKVLSGRSLGGGCVRRRFRSPSPDVGLHPVQGPLFACCRSRKENGGAGGEHEKISFCLLRFVFGRDFSIDEIYNFKLIRGKN